MKRFLQISAAVACLIAGTYSFRIYSDREAASNLNLAGDAAPQAPVVPSHLQTIPPSPTKGAGKLADPQSDALFQAALKDYDKRSYAHAIAGFYKVSALDPGVPAPHFYLGVSYLLTNDVAAAISELHLASMLGDKTYAERAHYYLAQAFWRQHESKRAEQELDTVILAAGNLKREAEILKGEMYVADGQTR